MGWMAWVQSQVVKCEDFSSLLCVQTWPWHPLSKGVPFTGYEGVDARVHIYTATALEEVGWLVVCLTTFTPGESMQYSFYRRLSGPQDQSGHEGVKNNLHPSDTWDRIRAIWPVVKRLVG